MSETLPAGEQAPQQKTRTGLFVAIVCAAVALVVLVVALTVAYAFGSIAHTPGKRVAAYLDALVAGKASAALKLDGTTPTDRDILLTDKAYRAASNRITGYKLGRTTVSGNTATVTATIRQGSKSHTESFTLDKSGRDLVVFDVWKLRPVPLGAVAVAVDGPNDLTVTVGGAKLTHSQAAVRLRAFPGTYTVTPSAGKWYSAAASKATVSGFGGSADATVTAKLTDVGTQSADAAVERYIDTCAASTDFAPDGCSFGVTGADPAATYTDKVWTISPRPTFTVTGWNNGGWAVRTDSPGIANFAAKISSPQGTGTVSGGPIPMRVDGFVTFTDTGATFVPGSSVASSL